MKGLGYWRFDLYLAIKENDFNRTKKCLEMLTTNNVLHIFDSDDDNRQVPILFVLAKFGRCGAWLDLFLEYIPINQEDKEENIALHVAAKYGQLEFYKALTSKGLLIKLNKFGHSPIYAAAERPYMFQELLRYHQLNTESTLNINLIATMLPMPHYLIQTENIEAFQILLDHYNWTCEQFIVFNDFNGLNPLEFAVKIEKNCFIDLIFKHYRSAESQRNLLYNSHVLHVAASTNNHTTVKQLLELKADPELVDKSGKIPKAYTTNHSICFLLDNAKLKRLAICNVKPSQWCNLVFQGGGVKGIAHVGALCALVEKGILNLDNIERVGGTSAGAINALLVGLEYSLDEIRHLIGIESIGDCDLPIVNFSELLDGDFSKKILAINDKNFKEIFGDKCYDNLRKIKDGDGHLVRLVRFLDGTFLQGVTQTAPEIINFTTKVCNVLKTTLGVCPGNELFKLFNLLINKKLAKIGYIQQEQITTFTATFKDLENARLTRRMYFVGINIRNGAQEVFSIEKTENMIVANAVRISMSIPGIFEPQKMAFKNEDGTICYGEDLYVDGGLLWNYPIQLFDRAQYTGREGCALEDNDVNRKTLGIRLVSLEKKQPDIDENADDMFCIFRYLKSLGEALLNKEASDLSRQGNEFRSINVYTGEINTLDFKEVDKLVVKKGLFQFGQDGVIDFIEKRSIKPSAIASPKCRLRIS